MGPGVAMDIGISADTGAHVWLTGKDLRGAYANCLPKPELERALHPFVFDDIPSEGHESQPCPT